MIEFNLTNKNTNDVFTSNDFDNIIDKIINDSNIKGLEMTINDMKEKVIDSILDVGYCTIKVKDITFTLIAYIDGIQGFCFHNKNDIQYTYE